MTRRSIVAAAGTLAAVTLMAAASWDPGVVFEVTSVDHTSSTPRTEVSTMEISGANMAMAVVGPGGEGRVIFLGDRNEMIIEDHANGSYTRIDQATVDRLAEQVNAAMSQLEQMLAGLPEAQREMMRQMQGEMSIPGLSGAEAPVIEVRASGRSDTRAGYPVREWEVLEDGQVERRMWVTPWSEIEGGDEVRGAFTGMATFFDAFLSAMPSLPGAATMQNPFTSIDEMGGMPVVTEELRADGSVERSSEVTGVERRELPASTFEPAPGLSERPLPDMGG